MPLVGIDTGGTFTDFVVIDGTALRIHKVLSVPQAPEQAILQGLRELGLLDRDDVTVVHGSTVATNAVLEGKGVRTAFITNQGFRDLLSIGRQARQQLYELNPPPLLPPVPPELCLEVAARLGADGSVVEALSAAELMRLHQQVTALKPAAVAINLLFSYLDDEHERRIAAALPPALFISRSSQVLPEYREYERGITTWLNAAVGPLVKGYLQRLRAAMPWARLAVMQSAGGSIDAGQAGEQAVHMLLSGPAGGLAGARFIAQRAGQQRLLSFDMGGTSTDVALLDGELRLTTEGRIGPYPVGVPMVDLHTIGAGGGSIARIDSGGLLQVGPESAGASPGPACYGRGGVDATVTDANLVLGRLHPERFLGGAMRLDVTAARTAVGNIATGLGVALHTAAAGIIAIANEHMARALRLMSVARGIDPAGLTLVSFGGAGGLHVCALAEALGMSRALVPVHGGVLSALGMLVAPRLRQLSRTVTRPLDAVSESDILVAFEQLTAQGIMELEVEAVHRDDMAIQRSADVRYRGQSYAINVPWSDIEATYAAFHARHESLYGHRLDLPLEVVTLRVRVTAPPRVTEIAAPAAAVNRGIERQRSTLPAPDSTAPLALHERSELRMDAVIHGPALITETVATTYLAAGWDCRVDGSGSLLLTRATVPAV